MKNDANGDEDDVDDRFNVNAMTDDPTKGRGCYILSNVVVLQQHTSFY